MLENDFRFELIENGYMVVELLNDSLDKVIIPDTYNNKPVIKIEKECFKGCKNIREIIIPDSVLEIGKFAFEGCVNLINVILSNNLKVISQGLFNYSGIKKIVIPNSVNKIESIAFYRCESLEEVVLPENLDVIGRDAFGYCINLKKIKNLDCCESIENGAFRNCESLTDVFAVGRTKHISDYAFHECKNIKNASVSCPVTDINDTVFHQNTRIYQMNSFFDEYGEECCTLPIEIKYRETMNCPCNNGIIRIIYEKAYSTYDYHFISCCEECNKKYVIRYYFNKDTEDYDVYYVLKKYRLNEYGVDSILISSIPEGSVLIMAGVNNFFRKVIK